MANFAALLVLVLCPVDSAHCVSEPIRVVSYDTMGICERNRPVEIKQAEELGLNVIGFCNPIEAKLITGKHFNLVAGIDISTDTNVSSSDVVSSYSAD